MTLPLAARADEGGPAELALPAVARLSVVDGTVAIARGDANAGVDAVVNAPVLAADYVTTGARSRAEVEFDGRTVVRLGANVQMRFSHVDAANRQLQVAAGTIDFRLLRGTDGRTSIDTPSISVVPRATGTYRVTVDNDGTTFVTVREGHADIDTPQGGQPLDPGTTLVAQGTASDPQLSTRDAIAYDSFDAFNQDRDRAEQNAVADSPYVNNAIGGVSDLGAYGQWADDGSYGHVWMPNDVAAGWAPYRDGSWAWEAGYGWTWIAAEPWGWAPYHYGRWYYSTAYSRWAWYPPGPAIVAPAWRPALVGFIGLSFGAVGVGVGFGNVAWVPLAPYETYRPNLEIGANIARAYRNAQFNGVSSVSLENFRAGRFGGAVAVSPRQLALAHPLALRGGLPPAPAASNLRADRGPAYAAQRAPSFAAERAPSYAERAPSYAAERAPSYARGAVTAYSRPAAAPSYGDRAGEAQAAYGNRYGYSAPSYGSRSGYAQPAYGNRSSYAQPSYSRPAYQRSAPARQTGASRGRAESYQR